MKISTGQMYDHMMLGVQKQLKIYGRGVEQVSSGRRIHHPGQDPLAYKTSLKIRHEQRSVESSLRAIHVAKLRLGATQDALSRIVPILQRAQAIAVQQANGSLTASDRNLAASEVGRLQEQLLNLANETLGGVPLFAGTATGGNAVSMDALGNIQYMGNAQNRVVAITPTLSVVTNVRADHPAFQQAFSSIKALKDALAANDGIGIRNAIKSLNDAANAMVDLTSEIGSRLRSIDLLESSYMDMRSQLEVRLGEHEGADIATVATELSRAQTTLQALYAVMARLDELSLARYLG